MKQKKIEADHHKHIQNDHVEYANAVLQSGIADNAPIAASGYNRNKATDCIKHHSFSKVIMYKVINRKIKPEKITQERRERDKKKVDKNNDPSR